MSKADIYTSFMEEVARDDSHGYSQLNRYGDPDYDCSWLTIDALRHAGFEMAGATYTGNMDKVLEAEGFKNVISSVNVATGAGLIRGDVLRKPGHVAVYCGNGMEVEAAADEYGGIEGRNPGDQTGWEILIQPYQPVWTAVYRYDENQILPETYSFKFKKVWKGCTGKDVKRLQALLRARGFRDDDGNTIKIDGVFGDKTEQAVKRFQKKYKLDADGIVGRDTWTKLLY